MSGTAYFHLDNVGVAVVSGGIGSVIAGGKFENGAVTGAFGYIFSELAHVGNLPIRPGSGALPYFDSSISDRVSEFFRVLQEEGIPIQLTDGFRTGDMQGQLTGNQYGGARVGGSLHEAGFAFDINYGALTKEQRSVVFKEAQSLGFQSGQGFSIPDPVHLQYDPFFNVTVRRAYIPTAQQQYRDLTNEGIK